MGSAANAYRPGLAFVVCITFMVEVVAVYWLYAPRLQRLCVRKAYIMLGDYIRDRYGAAKLTLALNLIFLVTCAVA